MLVMFILDFNSNDVRDRRQWRVKKLNVTDIIFIVRDVIIVRDSNIVDIVIVFEYRLVSIE